MQPFNFSAEQWIHLCDGSVEVHHHCRQQVEFEIVCLASLIREKLISSHFSWWAMMVREKAATISTWESLRVLGGQEWVPHELHSRLLSLYTSLHL